MHYKCNYLVVTRSRTINAYFFLLTCFCTINVILVYLPAFCAENALIFLLTRKYITLISYPLLHNKYNIFMVTRFYQILTITRLCNRNTILLKLRAFALIVCSLAYAQKMHYFKILTCLCITNAIPFFYLLFAQ